MTDPPASTKERAQRADGPVRSVPAKEPCKPSDQRFSRLWRRFGRLAGGGLVQDTAGSAVVWPPILGLELEERAKWQISVKERSNTRVGWSS